MRPRSLTTTNPFHRAGDEMGRRLAAAHRSLRRENVPLMALLSLELATICALLAYLLEGGADGAFANLGDAAWWTVVTISTTGYGDLVPKTPGGRIVGALAILAGMGLLSVFTATVASALTARRIQEEKGLQKVKAHHHVVICGWNGHAQRVIEGLVHGSAVEPPEMVLVNQLPEETINDIIHHYHHWKVKYVRGDFCYEATLRRANLEAASAVLVLADYSAGLAGKVDDRTVLAVLAIRSINPTAEVCAEIAESENEIHLRRAGVDDVVISGEHNGFLLSSAAVAPGLPQVVRELLTFAGPHGLRRRPIPPGFVGKTFGDLARHLRETEKAILIGLVSDSGAVTLDDLLAGDYSTVDAFIKQQFAQAGMEYLTLTRERARVHVNPLDDRLIGQGDSAVLLGGDLS